MSQSNQYHSDNVRGHIESATAHIDIGGFDTHNDLQHSLRVNPIALELDGNGVELSPEYMRQALRSLAGMDMNPGVSGAFPFAEQVLPIIT